MSKTIKTPDSSCIAETEYIPTGKRVGNVRIRFNSGSEFVYYAVDLWRYAAMHRWSVGRGYNRLIKRPRTSCGQPFFFESVRLVAAPKAAIIQPSAKRQAPMSLVARLEAAVRRAQISTAVA